ncbi:unnamed protein product [Medioppia subpectinata]|uniref:Uncharacterized protein n=1 Tax=Medioppia subpectinata TaxID=1979941 RepID=A0A7R9KB46_9ACAR|nr:unnamed protein product [Medioppia subpectinata]CAG2100209.1 unnamed protein product [Medioppia subpectinata]
MNVFVGNNKMWFFVVLSYFALLVQLFLIVLSVAAGLYYLAELVEEFSVISAKVIKSTILLTLFIYLCLFLFEELPNSLIITGIVILLLVNHYFAFSYFSSVYYPFTQVLAFFTICLWLIPFAFFISLSANENVLPTIAETRPLLSVIEVQSLHNHIYGHLMDTHYDQWVGQKCIKRQDVSQEIKSFESKSDVMFESEYLFKRVGVLCLVLSKSRKSSQAVRLTWANHCNHVIFFGPFSDRKIPVIKYPPASTHVSFCHSFITAMNQFSGQFDWLFIAYDETYAIIENLRHYVAPLNASSLYYLGRAVKHYFSGVYNAADSGIVLSRGAVERIAKAFSNETVCDLNFIEGIGSVSRNFEISLALILGRFGCTPVDTRDLRRRGRFHAFPPERQLVPGMISMFNSYWRNGVFLSSNDEHCCSDKSITFNGVLPAAMYLTEYLLYHMSIFSTHNNPLGLGNKPPPYSSYKYNLKSWHIWPIDPNLILVNTLPQKSQRFFSPLSYKAILVVD